MRIMNSFVPIALLFSLLSLTRLAIAQSRIGEASPLGQSGLPGMVNYSLVNKKTERTYSVAQMLRRWVEMLERKFLDLKSNVNREVIQTLRRRIQSLESQMRQRRFREMNSDANREVIQTLRRQVEMLEGKLQELTSTVNREVFERLEALESDAMRTKQVVTTDSNPTTRITTPMATTPQPCPMWIGGSCFTLVKDKEYNREEAVEVCSQRSSHLADITSKSTFDMLMNRIRLHYLGSGLSSIQMFLGMTITPSTGQVALSDGRNAPYVRWYPGFPWTSSSRTAMLLQVDADRMSANQYFYNYPPRYSFYALCQMND